MAETRRFTLPRAIHDWLTKPPSHAESKADPRGLARKRQAATYLTGRTGYRVTYDMGPEAAAELAALCREAVQDPAVSESGKGAMFQTIRVLELAAR